jgi:hypothetical protein
MIRTPPIPGGGSQGWTRFQGLGCWPGWRQRGRSPCLWLEVFQVGAGPTAAGFWIQAGVVAGVAVEGTDRQRGTWLAAGIGAVRPLGVVVVVEAGAWGKGAARSVAPPGGWAAAGG